jgi:NTP pyrophosphatase (non-canonical NTP hydrolase)
MNFVEFNEHCKRTRNESDLFVWRKHYTLGIFEELGEIAGIVKRHSFYNQPLNVEKLKEEIGDFLWYFMGFVFDQGSEIPGLVDTLEEVRRNPDHFMEEYAIDEPVVVEPTISDIMVMGTLIVGAFGDGLDAVEGFSIAVVSTLNKLAHMAGTTLEECMELNVPKLAKRYPNGYTDEHAAMRLDKQEESE